MRYLVIAALPLLAFLINCGGGCDPTQQVCPVPPIRTSPVPVDSMMPMPGASITPMPGASITPMPGKSTTPMPGTSTSPISGASPGANACLSGVITVMIGGNTFDGNGNLCQVGAQSHTRRVK